MGLPARRFEPRNRFYRPAQAALFLAAAAFLATTGQAQETPRLREVCKGITYFNQSIRVVPWSINVVTVDRSRNEFSFTTTLAGGVAQGLEPLSEQLAAIPAELGAPLVAINGDFYRTEHEACPGDPRGIEIRNGELISAPVGNAAFWITTDGDPKLATVTSKFRFSWPGARQLPFGLNEERDEAEAVLYTARFGSSTRTRGGREIVLDEGAGKAFQLQAGRDYTLRVREVRAVGNSRIPKDAAVLSLGPDLLSQLPGIEAGSTIQLSTATLPDLKEAKEALGGGPILIQEGVVQPVNSNKASEAHPRSAFGWNDREFIFVQVDGRQPGFSMGMRLRDLAQYMAKLGCRQAMNLDGGGSSTLWVDGRVMNRPCYGHERPIANGIAIVRKEKSRPAGGK